MSYFTKSADDEEMGNTDENVTQCKRDIPQMAMQNLVTAIKTKTIPESLYKLLQKSQRFRIDSCIRVESRNTQNPSQAYIEQGSSFIFQKSYEKVDVHIQSKKEDKKVVENKPNYGLRPCYVSRNKLAQKELIDETQIDTSDYDPVVVK